MIRILTILLGAVVFAAVFAQLVGYGVLYTVDQTEHAVITRFGNVQSVVSEPGLQFKSPIESVTRFDKRLLRINVPTAAMPDKESQFLEIDAYVRYRITDPQAFLETLRDQDTASARIGNLAIAALRAEIGLRDRRDIIGGDPINLEDGTIIVKPRVDESSGSFAREALRSRVLERTKITAEADFGVIIDDVRIKRSEFPSATEASVFQRMRTERAVQAQKLRAEGEEQYLTITADVDKNVRIITADANQKANKLRGEGEAQAIAVLAEALEKDPEFFAFRRSLEAYGKALADGTTVVLSSESDLFGYLESPDKPSNTK
ncbi:MAG: protease modulator HflC [SAR202 cluster bacterium]|nr:protease modulator HflC [SAR202 cluster bacterium]|tara:strand:+ start:6224 stop:7180 length:957 start_codon:yes stop_codon:yes gene_type:complete